VNTRLILVEGMPGAGKSTLSQFIAARFNAPFLEEREAEHYMASFWQAHNERRPDLPDVLLACWRTFLESVRASDQPLIFDAGFYYAMHLMELNVSPQQIHAYNRALLALAADLCPLVIHLTTDVARVYPLICKERGDDWTQGVMNEVNAFPYQTDRGRTGLPGLIAFFEDGQQLVTDLVAAWNHLTINTTERRWDEYRRDIVAGIA
jgi:deoxyadenosine/deoxycytidine kinase